MEFETQSGATAVITAGSWKECMALWNAVQRQLVSSGGFTLNETMQNLAMKVYTAPAVYDALSACLKRCTYNGQKITDDIFEDADARRDYYQIVTACLEENMRPFFETLPAQLPALCAILIPAQKVQASK